MTIPPKGIRKNRMLTPETTRMLAATTCPAIRAGAETSRRSSTIPNVKTSTAEISTPSGSVLDSKTGPNTGRHHAKSRPADIPTSMARPPRVGGGHRVHPPLVRLHHRAEPQGEPANEEGDTEGDRRRYPADSGVIADGGHAPNASAGELRAPLPSPQPLP